MKFDIVIGIETHIQLNTATKMFCRCQTNSWQAEPNTHTCPVCLGLPGALPVINKSALDKAILVGLALQSKIARRTKFDRKNYFYPDLAKGYQISQYDEPLNIGGAVEVEGETIGLVRAHLEEDVGKLTHSEDGTLVDFNKAGTPLMEIVSEPVIRSAAQAKAYVQALRQLVRYLEVNDGNMEQGKIRADVNISLQEPGKWQYTEGAFNVEPGYVLHNRVEIKNLNSFRNIERAVLYEVGRQRAELEAGREISQETRGWDEVAGVTTSQRTKEEAHDYRYFPEPDLPPLDINEKWVAAVKERLPELPGARRQRFMAEYGLNDYDARLLCAERTTAEWFEMAVLPLAQAGGEKAKAAKAVANWLLGELSRLQNDQQKPLHESGLQPAQLASIITLVQEGKISAANAKEVVAQTFTSGVDPQKLIDDRGLNQLNAADDLIPLAKKVIGSHPDVVANIRQGKISAVQFLVGQVMKETRGRANPAMVREVLEAELRA